MALIIMIKKNDFDKNKCYHIISLFNAVLYDCSDREARHIIKMASFERLSDNERKTDDNWIN